MKVNPIGGGTPFPPAEMILCEDVALRHVEIMSEGRERSFTKFVGGKTPDVSVMLEEMQRFLTSMNVSLQFTTYGEKGERIAIVITNSTTGEIIREIPPEELQRLYVRLTELQGILFNVMA